MPTCLGWGITGAAGNVQKAGLIKYSRGHITVLDLAGLERRARECYGVVKKELIFYFQGQSFHDPDSGVHTAVLNEKL